MTSGRTEDVCSVAEIRLQMEIASAFAKSHGAFVVIPASNRAEFEQLCGVQVRKLEALASAGQVIGAKKNLETAQTALQKLIEEQGRFPA